LVAVGLVVALAAGGCGGAKAPAHDSTSSAGEEPEPTNASGPVDATGDGAPNATGGDKLESQWGAFDVAESELHNALRSGGSTKEPHAQPEEDGEEIVALSQANRCEVACKALASMIRAAENVCALTGDDDARCTKLRGRIERAKATVFESCPTCVAARN
jgi:hypothetical protein